MIWVVLSDGTMERAEVIARRLWGRVEVRILTGELAGARRIVAAREVVYG